MWLRDLLPQHLPAVRVMIYGYSAQVQGATQATSILEDHAETFRQRLLLFRRFEAVSDWIVISRRALHAFILTPAGVPETSTYSNCQSI